MMALSPIANQIGQYFSFSEIREKHNLSAVEVYVDFLRDCIALILTDKRGRKFCHPRFVTRREADNGTWINVVNDRFISAITGVPSNGPDDPVMSEPTFSLSEIEEAQKLVDSFR